VNAVKKLAFNLGLFVLSATVCLGLLECLVRWLFPMYDPAAVVKFYFNQDGVLLGEKNTVANQSMKAGDFNVQIHINQYGFRDKKDVKWSTAKDWFVVGDSFSFGHGVEEEDRYSNVLEGMLGQPVYNISIPADFDGYDKLVAYAQQHGATIKQLLIGVCMENDLQHYIQQASPSSDISSSEHDVQASSSSPYDVKIRKSIVFRLRMFLGERLAIYNLVNALFYRSQFLERIIKKVGFVDKSEEVLESSSDRLVRLKMQRDIPEVVVVIIPSRALWLGENKAVERQIHTRFVEFLKQRGFPVIDLLPYFEAGGNPLQYHFKNDGHWNMNGHGKAAEVIAAYLREWNLNKPREGKP